MNTVQKLSAIFILAFICNFIWENLHAKLYFLPSGEMITQLMLLRSTFGDAVIVTILGIVFIKIEYFKQRKWLLLIFGIIIAIVIEIFSLKTGRWAYNDLMPIIPFINTGLTPTIQIGALSYLIIYLVDYRKTERIDAK